MKHHAFKILSLLHLTFSSRALLLWTNDKLLFHFFFKASNVTMYVTLFLLHYIKISLISTRSSLTASLFQVNISIYIDMAVHNLNIIDHFIKIENYKLLLRHSLEVELYTKLSISSFCCFRKVNQKRISFPFWSIGIQ